MKKYLLISVAAAGLALSGCDSEDVENTPVDDIDEVVDADDEGYPVAGELTDEQRAKYDSFDRDAAVREYDTSRESIRSGSSNGTTGDVTSSSSSRSDANTGEGASASSGSSENQATASPNTSSSNDVASLRPRSQMDFAFLDRNGDGKLSVAEYAIWAVRSNPREPKRNDNTRPYTSVDQINEAGETFFYFDADGDTYLSPQEFGAARSSARTPS